MTEPLINRRVAVTIARLKQNTFFGVLPNAIVVRDLRVKFKVEKSLGEDPNTCAVEIYNFAESTRAEVEHKPLHVRLDAGWGENLQRLFTGDLTHASTKRDGNVGWITTLTLAEGGRAYQNARVKSSFAKGTKAKAAIAEIAESMGLKMPTNVNEAKELAEQFVSGVSLTGPSRTQMTKILKGKGFGWSIQNDELQILRRGDVRAETAYLVNQRTGMLGSPALGAPNEPGEAPTLTLKMRLYPALTPGARIKVEAAKINGIFRLSKVTHTGDTRGAEWYTDIEAKQL